MGFWNRFAEWLARRVDDQKIIDYIKPSINNTIYKEVSEQVGKITAPQLEQLVAAHLNSGEFKTRLEGTVGGAINKALEQNAPVLVLDDTCENSDFKKYIKSHPLEGPIGTVNASAVDPSGNRAYDLALNRLKIQARQMGGNVIEVILDDEDFSGTYGHRFVGQLYINPALPGAPKKR